MQCPLLRGRACEIRARLHLDDAEPAGSQFFFQRARSLVVFTLRSCEAKVAIPRDFRLEARGYGSPKVMSSLNASGSMSRLLGTPLPLAPWVLRCGSRVTQRWRRDGFEGFAPGMPGHVVCTYYRDEQTCRWTMENVPLAARLRSGTITVIPENHDGRWSLGGPVDVSHVYLTSERLQACADQVARGRRVELHRRVGFDDVISARILKMLAHEARVDDTSSSLFVEQATDLLCLQLLRRHATFAPEVPRVAPGGLARWQTTRVTQFMTEHLAREIRLAELAALVGLSRFHFCSAFRVATGTSPHAWLTEARMRRARELLADPKVPITQVALAVGFQSSSAFGASFRRVVGMSPSEYRRRL